MDNADTTTAATPKLWNPNAAANFSLLFSPILGAWLHAKNWKELGQHDRAKKSMIWVYIGFVFQLVNLFLPDNLGGGLALIFLFAWYFSSGKGQVKYLKENNINYEKKAWGKPLLLGLAGWAAYFVVGFVLIAEPSSNEVLESESVSIVTHQERAAAGDATAQAYLGWMYNNGEGVPKDDAETVKWYRKAAEQGNAVAQYNLGAMYTNGSGVPKDNVKAYMFFNLAAAQGDKDAEENREQIGEYMTQEQIAEGQKLTREWLERKAKEKGQ
ncbi:sel1 repeat family protein [Akkermansiaceae bacterium]|nr:sel1 repeat family protein [Akkermansiaceae bacterium]